MSRFEEFWNHYPKKVSRKKCEETWKKKKLDDHVDVIIAHLKQRVRDDKKWHDGFVLDPTTFLNQERWTDQYEKIAPKRDTSKPMTIEVKAPWPQPCRWKAALNRLLIQVCQDEPHKAPAIWDTLLEMRDFAAGKFAAEYGDVDVETKVWRGRSEKTYAWFLGEVRQPGTFAATIEKLKGVQVQRGGA